MKPVKCLSAGLIAVAMFTTSAMAHSVPERYEPSRANAAIVLPGPWLENHARMPASAVANFSASSRSMPGGVCDHGDDPMIC
ncbi:hypothetical protein J6500_06440 [Bradyrhizobium sp. WSM 1704]|uniref:hypothetical protein n=1 Tax=Bradyrhizobium semiaridum TaxID=2821404 RepID=UPI001CE33709|nr:hypothetical protein [Bradyrhizobium semiaridum]MCA6121545.1 hypothetical protein [Bradyrhizobium semiaridum]